MTEADTPNDELDEQDGELLPNREVMTVVDPVKDLPLAPDPPEETAAADPLS